ncbi:hypothetical protein EV424DRAFT_1372280 [Suillus variegatus]|nr:hypothetical protein EV424DRAFT_1372280 [Suillus variegatus]
MILIFWRSLTATVTCCFDPISRCFNNSVIQRYKVRTDSTFLNTPFTLSLWSISLLPMTRPRSLKSTSDVSSSLQSIVDS